jgi:hypothetical protein
LQNKIANVASLFFLFPKSSSILFENPILGGRTAKVLTDEVKQSLVERPLFPTQFLIIALSVGEGVNALSH